MPTQIKGPAIFLAQFGSDDAPFNSLHNRDKTIASYAFKISGLVYVVNKKFEFKYGTLGWFSLVMVTILLIDCSLPLF